jgi:hypothetical protein
MDVVGRWFHALLMVLTVSPAGAAEAFARSTAQEEVREEEPPFPKARLNPLLRRFFREMYPRSGGPHFSVNEEFLERFVDRQVDQFVEDIDRRLEELTAASEMVEGLRIRYVEEGSGVDRQEVRRALAGSLRRIADQTSGLAGRLAMVFRGLERRKRLDIRITPESRVLGFVEEIDFMSLQIAEADRLVRDYLFRGTGTVRLEDLGGEDMLVRLDWAEKVAREVARNLR